MFMIFSDQRQFLYNVMGISSLRWLFTLPVSGFCFCFYCYVPLALGGLKICWGGGFGELKIAKISWAQTAHRTSKWKVKIFF